MKLDIIKLIGSIALAITVYFIFVILTLPANALTAQKFEVNNKTYVVFNELHQNHNLTIAINGYPFWLDSNVRGNNMKISDRGYGNAYNFIPTTDYFYIVLQGTNIDIYWFDYSSFGKVGHHSVVWK